MLYWILLLASSCSSVTAATYPHLSRETTPLGGYNFSLDRVNISRRQDLTIGFNAECSSYFECKANYAKHPVIDTVNDIAPPEEAQEDSSSYSSVESVNPAGNLYCWPPPTGKYKDSHRERVEAISMEFCNIYCASSDEDQANLPIRKLFSAHKWKFGLGIDDWSVGFLRNKKIHRANDVYDFKVELVEGCMPEGILLDLRRPVGDERCYDILVAAWSRCNNKGRGGSLQAGCLRYSIATRF